MANATLRWFGLAPKALLSKEVDYLNDTIRGMLCTAAYVPDQDVHDYKNDVTNEVSGTGYTAGGQVLSNKSVTYSGASNTGKIDADDLSWTFSTISNARVLVIYDDTPASISAKPLLFYGVFDGDVSTSAATLLVTFDTAGIVTWVAA